MNYTGRWGNQQKLMMMRLTLHSWWTLHWRSALLPHPAASSYFKYKQQFIFPGELLFINDGDNQKKRDTDYVHMQSLTNIDLIKFSCLM